MALYKQLLFIFDFCNYYFKNELWETFVRQFVFRSKVTEAAIKREFRQQLVKVFSPSFFRPLVIILVRNSFQVF